MREGDGGYGEARLNNDPSLLLGGLPQWAGMGVAWAWPRQWVVAGGQTNSDMPAARPAPLITLHCRTVVL